MAYYEEINSVGSNATVIFSSSQFISLGYRCSVSLAHNNVNNNQSNVFFAVSTPVTIENHPIRLKTISIQRAFNLSLYDSISNLPVTMDFTNNDFNVISQDFTFGLTSLDISSGLAIPGATAYNNSLLKFLIYSRVSLGNFVSINLNNINIDFPSGQRNLFSTVTLNIALNNTLWDSFYNTIKTRYSTLIPNPAVSAVIGNSIYTLKLTYEYIK